MFFYLVFYFLYQAKPLQPCCSNRQCQKQSLLILFNELRVTVSIIAFWNVESKKYKIIYLIRSWIWLICSCQWNYHPQLPKNSPGIRKKWLPASASVVTIEKYTSKCHWMIKVVFHYRDLPSHRCPSELLFSEHILNKEIQENC